MGSNPELKASLKTKLWARDPRSTATHIYFNASIVNANIDENGANPPVARFQEMRTTPLIQHANDYYFSVVRLSLDGPGRVLPLFIPLIQTGQQNPNLTIYGFSIKYQWTGQSPGTNPLPVTSPFFTQSQYVSFVPENSSLPVKAPTILQDLSNAYYYLHSYSAFVDMVNACLQSILSGLQSQFGAWFRAQYPAFQPPSIDPSIIPLLTYCPTSGLFSFTLNAQAYQSGVSVSPYGFAQLFMNSASYGLFANFPTAYTPSDPKLTYKLQVSSYLPIASSAASCPDGCKSTSSASTVVKVTQDFISTSQLWSPIDSIVFQSIFIPVLNEQTSAPVALGTNNLEDGTKGGFTTIITDLVTDQSRADDNVGFLFYQPTGEYRLADLTVSDQPIQNIDLTVCWKNRLTQELIPIPLYNLSSVGIKILFRKRSF